MNFKEFVSTIDIPENHKVDIINYHVTEEREILDRTNNLLATEQLKVQGLQAKVRQYQSDKEKAEERLRKCVEECRGALAAASALIRYQHGTHMMKAHQNEAVAAWIDTAREKMKDLKPICDEELPF